MRERDRQRLVTPRLNRDLSRHVSWGRDLQRIRTAEIHLQRDPCCGNLKISGSAVFDHCSRNGLVSNRIHHVQRDVGNRRWASGA